MTSEADSYILVVPNPFIIFVKERVRSDQKRLKNRPVRLSVDGSRGNFQSWFSQADKDNFDSLHCCRITCSLPILRAQAFRIPDSLSPDKKIWSFTQWGGRGDAQQRNASGQSKWLPDADHAVRRRRPGWPTFQNFEMSFLTHKRCFFPIKIEQVDTSVALLLQTLICALLSGSPSSVYKYKVENSILDWHLEMSLELSVLLFLAKMASLWMQVVGKSSVFCLSLPAYLTH